MVALLRSAPPHIHHHLHKYCAFRRKFIWRFYVELASILTIYTSKYQFFIKYFSKISFFFILYYKKVYFSALAKYE